MRLLIQNNTVHLAYIVVIDYDNTTKYIGKPIIFELEAGCSCYHITTSEYFFGAMINEIIGIGITSYNNVNKVEINHNGQTGWTAFPYFNHDTSAQYL